jgi:predicted transcriptional regulator
MQDRRIAFRVRRAALDLTQRKAADAAGVELNRFVRIENGFTDPTDAEIKRIAKALKSTRADLFPESVSA